MNSSLAKAHNQQFTTTVDESIKKLPYYDRYCPECLNAVDPKTGDHWSGGCEYERTYRDWVNPKQPLTRVEVIEIKLKQVTEQIQQYSNTRRDLIVALDKASKELKEKGS